MTTQLWMGSTEVWESEDQVLSVVRQKCNVAARSVWFSRNADSGQLDGFGFIQFDSAADAALVMRLLKDAPIPHAPAHRVRLNWGKTRGDGDSEAVQQATGFQVYVGNLPGTVTDEKLLQYFRRYVPQAISARLIHGPDGLSRGFGFVRFSTFREVTEAIRALNGTSEFGSAIKVSEAAQNRIQGPDQGTDSGSATLFLRDIDPEIVKEETLLHHFRPYGNVLRVRIVPGHPDWANVTMETHVEAECAKVALQGSRFGGTTKCDIQFGRAVEDAPSTRAGKVTVPVINPKKAISRKAQAAFFDDAGVERVMEIMQRTAELRRDAPLAWAKPDVANRREARRRLEEDALFGWNQTSEIVPSSTCFWFYDSLA
jgi:RNA recognition motif-containing protein